MDVKNPNLVLVRGINNNWLKDNFGDMMIGFGGSTPQTLPKEDAYYIGLYVEAPVSKITHLGIVKDTYRENNYAEFYLKAIIELQSPVSPGHPIRKHENWSLSDFGLTKAQMDTLRNQLSSI